MNEEFSSRKKTKQVVEKSNIDPKNETNTITTSDGQEFRVVATKFDIETGFDGLVVAPIVNGEPDYKSIYKSNSCDCCGNGPRKSYYD